MIWSRKIQTHYINFTTYFLSCTFIIHQTAILQATPLPSQKLGPKKKNLIPIMVMKKHEEAIMNLWKELA
jgi:hypothetical protein